jgi:hypothetical protein
MIGAGTLQLESTNAHDKKKHTLLPVCNYLILQENTHGLAMYTIETRSIYAIGKKALSCPP